MSSGSHVGECKDSQTLGVDTLTAQEVRCLISKWKHEDLADRNPILLDYLEAILLKGAAEVVSEITTANAVTGRVVSGSAEGTKVLQYVSVPNPYDPTSEIAPEKFFYSIVARSSNEHGMTKYEHLGIAPIHGPCAELFRPWTHWVCKNATAGPGGAVGDRGEEMLWYPVSDILKLSDLLEHVKFCVPSALKEMNMKMEMDLVERLVYLPSYLKTRVELELFLPMTKRICSSLFPDLCLPQREKVDVSREEKYHPLATEQCAYYTAPCYIPISFPYQHVVNEKNAAPTALAAKQSPFIFNEEIIRRTLVISDLISFVQTRLMNDDYYNNLASKHGGDATRRWYSNSRDTSLYCLFDVFFSVKNKDEEPPRSSSLRSVDNNTPKDSIPKWVVHKRYARRQLITGTYEYAIKDRRSLGTDSMAHDFLLDALAYFYTIYMLGTAKRVRSMLSSLIMYRFSEQGNVWIRGGSPDKPRDIPDLSSLARFRLHTLLLNECEHAYFDGYADMFMTPQEQISRNADRTGTRCLSDASLQDVFMCKYKPVIEDFLSKYPTALDGEERDLLNETYELGQELADEMDGDWDAPPPVTMALNYDAAISMYVKSFVNADLSAFVRKFRAMEVPFYEENFFPGRRPPNEAKLDWADERTMLTMGKMFEIANRFCKRSTGER